MPQKTGAAFAGNWPETAEYPMKTRPAKAWAAGIGGTFSALATFFAAAQVVLDDGAINFDEYGAVGLAVCTLVGVIYAVWRVPNRPV